MKHPALTSALSVFLAVLCVVQLLVGIHGFSSAEEDRDTHEKSYNRLKTRITRYENLKAELDANELDYDEASDRLVAREEQHHEDSSQHRTDLAMYTATRSGEIMGADALWEAKAAMPAAREMLDKAQAEFDEQAAAFYEQYNQFQQMKPLLEAAVNVVDYLLGNAEQIKTDIRLATEEPVLTEEQYAAAADAYWNAVELMNSIMDNEQIKEAAQNAGYDLDYIYNTILAYDSNYDMVLDEAETDVIITDSGEALINLLDNASEALDSAAAQAREALAAEEMLEMGREGIEQGGAALAEARKQLEDGEYMIQSSLEMLWYELGKLDTQKEELDEERERLMQESAEIQELRAQVEYYEDLTKRFKSSKLNLMMYEDISRGVNDEGLTLEEAYTAAYDKSVADAEHELNVRNIFCVLTIISAVFGIATVPAAFEKIKIRNFLFVCAILCAVISLGGEALFRTLPDLDSVYITLIMPIFAVITALTVLPQKKKKAN